MRRRDFLITGSTTAVLSAAGLSGIANANVLESAARTASSSIDVVLCEPRYEPSVEFARALERQGARVFSTHEDVVNLWRGELGRCLDCAAPRVAGLTLHSDLEILRMCARERKLRLISESLQRFDTVAHGRSGAVTLASWLIGR